MEHNPGMFIRYTTTQGGSHEQGTANLTLLVLCANLHDGEMVLQDAVVKRAHRQKASRHVGRVGRQRVALCAHKPEALGRRSGGQNVVIGRAIIIRIERDALRTKTKKEKKKKRKKEKKERK